MRHVDRHIGLPFRPDGRGPDGFDCWGLVKCYLEQRHGVKALPDYVGADAGRSIEAAMFAGLWVETDAPRDGDVVVMTTPVGQGRVAPLHVGVMVNATHVLHIDEQRASECLPLKHPMIAMRLHSFWRHVSLQELAR